MAKEKEVTERFAVQKVATEVQEQILDNEEELTVQQALVMILNKLEKLDKNLIG